MGSFPPQYFSPGNVKVIIRDRRRVPSERGRGNIKPVTSKTSLCDGATRLLPSSQKDLAAHQKSLIVCIIPRFTLCSIHQRTVCSPSLPTPLETSSPFKLKAAELRLSTPSLSGRRFDREMTQQGTCACNERGDSLTAHFDFHLLITDSARPAAHRATALEASNEEK